MTWVWFNRETVDPAVLVDLHNGNSRNSVLGDAEHADPLWLTVADANETERAAVGEQCVGSQVEIIDRQTISKVWCKTAGEVCLGESSCPSQNLGHELEVFT